MSVKDAPASGSAPEAAPGASAEDVSAIRARLALDPGIVLDDAATMHALIAADDGRVGRQVTDLRGAMVKRLESRLERLEETHRSVVAAAYENMSGTDQVHRAALALLEQEDFDELLAALEQEIPAILAVDALRLCIESDGGESRGAVVALPVGGVSEYLRLDRRDAEPEAALRVADPDAAALIFGPKAGKIRSEAAVRLEFGPDARPGMLVFGSADPHRFSPDQGSDLVRFLAGVAERALLRWMT